MAHCVKDYGPLWATSAFSFESHNHVLMSMFNGTQCVPQQITDIFLLQNKVLSLTTSWVDDDCSASVKELLGKLTNHARFVHNNASNGLATLGCGKLVTLDAHMLVALEDLLNETVDNRCGKMYDRFLYNHKLYSSPSYTHFKRHTNHHVSIQHSSSKYGRIVGLLNIKPLCRCKLEFSQYCHCKLYNVVFIKPMYASNRMLFRDQHSSSKYGRIVGLLNIKPLCRCKLEFSQYCHCKLYNVVFIKPMYASNRMLFRDLDFIVNSNFIVEVEESDDIIAMYPSQIERKCISLKLE